MRKLLTLLLLVVAFSAHAQKTTSLPSAAWDHSEWISVANAPIASGRADKVIRAADGASWFVADVVNEKKVISAKWMTAGLGVYELYLNGTPIGQEILKPGFTHYAKTKRSFTYDVTAAFNKKKGAKNQLSAQVTPGWWADKIITLGDTEGMIGKKCAFRGVLELTYKDGTKKYYGTNCEDWKAGIAGPVKHAAIYDGEVYDARELPGFATIDKLSKPEPNHEFKGEILPSEGAEIYLRQDLALEPVMMYVWQGISGEKQAEEKKDTEYGKVNIKRHYKAGEIITLHPDETLVVDFGQNCSAVPAFSFKADAGTVLTCLPAEILNDGNGAESRGMDGPEGSVHRRNLRIQDHCIRLDYTFGSSSGFVDYYPRCTFYGYRYLSVTATSQVEIKKIESLPVTSIAQDMEIGTITTGNELINRLISNTLWGQRSNYLSVPTDCPQRDERLGWMADTQVYTEAGSFFANTDRFFHKWTRDVRDSQSETGAYPGVAPIGQYGNEMMRLGWADAGVIVPWTVWKQFADKTIIDENWDAMSKFVDHLDETKYDQEALKAENGRFQFADWLSYEPLESWSGRFRETPEVYQQATEYWSYLGGCYWLMDAEMMADMAKATGRDTEKYAQMANRARTYLKETFMNADGTFKLSVLNTMQTPALFALKNRLVEGVAKENVIARLRQNFADHGNCLQTGFLGTSILMGTLTENGMADIAYELLFQRKNPSWLYSVDNGATTIWERWNSYTKESGMGPNGMNSFNHYAYGCVCEWIWETVAGISSDTNQPGFHHIIMRPIPDKRLGYVNAEYQSAAGLIKSSWRYEGDKWIWDFTIPAGATATVTLPGETTQKEYQSGTYQVVLSPCGPVPTENQLRWQDMEMYAFIHYSLNTYTDQEWGFGNEDPKLFNPSNLDCRQWARVCKQAGMKGIIFTAKHHCGFCMWPSEYTEYSVKNSPWKDGKGDVVRELADACREEGLKFAVYLSPWDRNHKDYGRQEYVTYFRNQLRELLTNYGDIFEVWFDGANGGDGWYGGANETRKIDRTTYYQWPETYKMIRELQPNCLIWNDGSDRGDLRWVGTEAGNVGETNWSLLNHDGEVTWPMLHYGLEDGDSWVPGETNTSIRPGWFYHELENEHVKSLSKLMDTYYKSVGRNSTLLLNFPIAPNGRIHPNDSLRGIAFNKMIQEVFKKDLIDNGKLTIEKRVDNNNVQCSARPKDACYQRDARTFNVQWDKPTTFNRFVAEEDIRYGQRVKQFSLEAEVDGQWVPLKDELVEGSNGLTTIGHRRIVCFPNVTATRLRFTILDSKCNPIISRVSIYLAPALTADIPDSGEKRSSNLHYFFSNPKQMMIDWDTEQTITSFRYLPPQNSKEGMVTHYTLWASTDWTNWSKLASGEFSNIINNPIWQTIKFAPVKAKMLRLDADRLAEGDRMAFDDIEVCK